MGSIFYIHGLNSSEASFAYLAKEVGGVPQINYDSHQPLSQSVAQVSEMIPKNEPVILIGHSLGGLIATTIAMNKSHDVQKVVAISSPFAGSKFAYWASWFFAGFPVLRDLTPISPAIVRLARNKVDCPHMTIVTTAGSSPWSLEPNDSIVTVSSQSALTYSSKAQINANHFEVLTHPQTVQMITAFLTDNDCTA